MKPTTWELEVESLVAFEREGSRQFITIDAPLGIEKREFFIDEIRKWADLLEMEVQYRRKNMAALDKQIEDDQRKAREGRSE